MIDVLVAGGGPVGLATALYACRAGLSVAVIEPRAGDIDKACGEGLMPEAVARLADLGVDPPGRPFLGIRYLDGTRSAEARFSHGPGRGVRRTVLHQALRRRAEAAGVAFVTDRVTSVVATGTSVEAGGITARYLVGADGLHSSVRAATGLDREARGPQRFGVRQHFRVEPWTDLVEVYWLPDVEVYVTPVADDVVGIAVLGGRPLSLDRALAATPALQRRIEGAAPASDERGAGPLRQSSSARTAGRTLLVGDAAGYVDALTGEGLRIGFAQAQAVVDAIGRDDPHSYEGEWLRITRSYRYLTGTLIRVAQRPALRRLVVPAARAVPGAFARVVDLL
ncbi:MAG: NAD(P)/FAD-dependent oxidoreductase [Actinomycetota bacterium]|nr:NAD(P)/FAD-dependent oxidoreductase [Actinomycetota bacterium]